MNIDILAERVIETKFETAIRNELVINADLEVKIESDRNVGR